MSDRLDTPGLIERATAYLSAARNSDGDARALYAARARVAFAAAEAELTALRLNLAAVEATLPEGKSDG